MMRVSRSEFKKHKNSQPQDEIKSEEFKIEQRLNLIDSTIESSTSTSRQQSRKRTGKLDSSDSLIFDAEGDCSQVNIDQEVRRNQNDIEGHKGQQFGEKFLKDGAPLPFISQEGEQIKGQQLIKKDENDVNLSFCGCGFLGIYHVGVASCFHQYAPQLSMHKISGSSAGAIVAVAHICGNLQLAYLTSGFLRVAIDARARSLGPFHPSFDINSLLRDALERGLPDDVHIRASGKLHISLTRVYDGENVVVSQFESKEEVIQALLCSCFIPFWSGLITPKFRGTSYMDGGFSKNLLILDDKTVTVSPFSGEADICPQDDTLNVIQVSLSNTSFSLTPSNFYHLSHALLPPPPEVLSDLCEQGFADGIRFLQQMKLISCNKCLEIRSSLLVTSSDQDMREEIRQQVNGNKFVKSTSSYRENHRIRLEQQEQKMIEINGGQRRRSVVSTTSQLYEETVSTSSSTSIACESADSFPLWDSNEIENCNECMMMRQKALRDPLPTQFSDRIRDACDAVNKSLSNRIYSYRPIKYLSYLAAPYYLPIDISSALLFKCWQHLPIIGSLSELLNCAANIVTFLIEILRGLHGRSTTELLMGSDPALEEECRAIKYEKETIRMQKSVATSNNSETTNVIDSTDSPNCPSNSGNRHQHNQSRFQSQSTTTTTTTTTTKTVESSISYKITSDRVCLSKLKNPLATTSKQQPQHQPLEDTFEKITDVAPNQEAVFAYHFRDAKNRLQVTEIFDLERPTDLQHSSSSNLLLTKGNNND